MLWTPRVWPGALLVEGEVVGTWRRAQATVVSSRGGSSRRPTGRDGSRGRLDAAARPARSDPGPLAEWAHDFNPPSTLLAGHGVEVTVTDQNTGGTMTIEVSNPY